MSVLGLGPLKAAFLCFVSSALVTAFKVLYKESIETVDRPSTKPPTKKSAFEPAAISCNNSQGKDSFKALALIRCMFSRACGRDFSSKLL